MEIARGRARWRPRHWNPLGKPKYQYWTGHAPAGNLDNRIKNAIEHPGSWWPDWIEWIKAQDGATVPAREPGGGALATIEDVPGSYVKVKD